MGGKALLYFEIVTTLAIGIGLLVANLVKPGHGVVFHNENVAKVAEYKEKAAGIDWMDFIRHIIPSNVVEAFAQGDVLQVLVFSVLLAGDLPKWALPAILLSLISRSCHRYSLIS
nr:cation:dicarboxylase symporter family transporter [Chitinophaga sedimenti]